MTAMTHAQRLLQRAGGGFLGIATLCGLCPDRGLAGQATDLVLEPCRASCELTLEVESEYGEDSGPAMIEAAAVVAWRDASNRMYIAGIYPVSHVWVFGPNGEFLRRIGRRGEGPGEFMQIQGAIAIDDGIFSLLDLERAAILTYDWTGSLLGETRMRGWIPTGAQTIHYAGHLAIHSGDIRTADRVGYPLHLFNLETGEIEKSFGSRTGEYHLGQGIDSHVVARGPDRAVWMGRVSAYEIELWEPDRPLRSMRREVDWFPELTPEQRQGQGHGWEAEPTPGLIALAADDSLIWVLIDTPDRRWKDAAETRDINLFVDTRVEVIDWRRGQVIASDRFDERLFAWVAPGLAGRLAVKSDGSVRYQALRLQLGRE